MIKSYGNRILQHTRNRNALPCVQVSLLNMQEYSAQDKFGPVLRILSNTVMGTFLYSPRSFSFKSRTFVGSTEFIV